MTVWCIGIFLQTATRSCTGQRRTAFARNKAFTLSNDLINRAVNVLALDTLSTIITFHMGVCTSTYRTPGKAYSICIQLHMVCTLFPSTVTLLLLCMYIRTYVRVCTLCTYVLICMQYMHDNVRTYSFTFKEQLNTIYRGLRTGTVRLGTCARHYYVRTYMYVYDTCSGSLYVRTHTVQVTLQ